MADQNVTTELFFSESVGWKYRDGFTLGTFEFEKLDRIFWHDAVSKSWKLPFYFGAVYVALIFGIQHWMRDRPAFKLKWPLFFWNAFLGVFSIIGFLRTGPDFVYSMNKHGFYSSICVRTEMPENLLFWSTIFAMSKFVELGDTVFIVLKKRPLIFLQWYHHVVTMWVTWTTAPMLEPIVYWYVVLNFGVHALMYPYFAMKTIGVHVPAKIANAITTLQLVQMLIGLGVNMTSSYLAQNGYNCARNPLSIQAFNLVYGSFVILFGRLFYESVVQSGHRKKLKKMD